MQEQKSVASRGFIIRLWLFAEAMVILCAGLMLASEAFSPSQAAIMFATGTVALLLFLGLCFGIASADRALLKKMYPVIWAVFSLLLLAKILLLIFEKK